MTGYPVMCECGVMTMSDDMRDHGRTIRHSEHLRFEDDGTMYAAFEQFTVACRAFGRELTKVVLPPFERMLDWIARKL